MATPGQNGAYWIRLHLAEFDDPRWLIIESFPEVADAVQIIYVRLLILAGKCNSGGMLLIPGAGGKPYGEVELAAVLRRQPATVRAALQMLENYGFVERVGDPPVLALPAWQDQDVDALALLANKRQRDAERKRLKRSEIKQLQASADTSADVSRNVRSHSKTKSNNQKTAATKAGQPAAAISSAAHDQNLNTPSPEVMAAIDKLPLTARLDCLNVALDYQHLPLEVLTSNIHRLAGRLASSKSKLIPNPGGWLQKALVWDYAASQRRTDAEAIAAKNRALDKKQEEAETDERARREELQRQAQLLQALQELDPDARAEVEREAEKRMRQIGAGSEPMRLACLAQAVGNYINGGATA
ncbi:MAG: phage replisome organizer N-terminal domain-containing protein [Geobacter sp.]